MHRVLLIVVATMLALAAPGAAQESKAYIGQRRDIYQLFVFGDSLAAGLGSGMSRALASDARFRVSGRFRDETGLARPDLYDWPGALGGILERNDVHIAIMMIGVNDGQDMRAGVERHPFGSAQWSAAYGQAVDQAIARLKQQGAAIYWIGLPPMADPAQDRAAKTLNELYRRHAQKAQVRFIDIHPAFTDEHGGFTPSGPDDTGEFTRLRTRDGVHMMRRGNNKLSRLVADEIRKDVDVAEGKRKADPPPAESAAAPGPQAAPEPGGPAFGQEASATEPIIVRPALTARAAGSAGAAALGDGGERALPAEGLPPRPGGLSAVQVLRSSIARGSPAATVFELGDALAPKPGRADDFTWPQP